MIRDVCAIIKNTPTPTIDAFINRSLELADPRFRYASWAHNFVGLHTTTLTSTGLALRLNGHHQHSTKSAMLTLCITIPYGATIALGGTSSRLELC